MFSKHSVTNSVVNAGRENKNIYCMKCGKEMEKSWNNLETLKKGLRLM